MKNIDNIKSSLCGAINAMSEKQLYELLYACNAHFAPNDFVRSKHIEDKELLSICALYSCDLCAEVFSECEDSLLSPDLCLERFSNYCKLEFHRDKNITS